MRIGTDVPHPELELILDVYYSSKYGDDITRTCMLLNVSHKHNLQNITFIE